MLMEILIPRLFKQHPGLRPEFLVTDNAMDINAVCAEVSRTVLVDPPGGHGLPRRPGRA